MRKRIREENEGKRGRGKFSRSRGRKEERAHKRDAEEDQIRRSTVKSKGVKQKSRSSIGLSDR